jgi:ATPase family associated with various cellular activities (AAA)
MDSQQKIINAESIFDNGFMCGKALYMYCFGKIPCSNYISGIDGEKAFAAIQSAFGHLIQSVHGYRNYNNRKKQYGFGETFVILTNGCLLELDNWYCEIYHNGEQEHFINECTGLISPFKQRERREPLEINLIVRGNNNNLQLKAMEIKRTKLDIGLFYEDDFAATDELIRKRLNTKKDKGIVLLHGLPGTGKTTYLRYLVGKIKKRVLFLSPTVAENLMSPDFVELLINNPDTVVIIEDAENIIMDRKFSNSSSVSNLLNISDGLLADFLNVQLICTFNNSLTMVDSALMRKGRLIAKYEFGKLSIEKAQRLSNQLGVTQVIDKPMTIAEITNPHEAATEQPKIEVLGFRREVMMN